MSVYNGQEYLAEAIDSILAQTFKDFEFLIIDDGSSDDSPDILDAYAQKDKRIKIIRQTNKGLVAALNKGLGLSRGTYIARMDADDVSLPGRLQKQIALAKSSGAALVGSGFYYIDTHGRKISSQSVWEEDPELKRALYAGNPFAHGSTLFLKDAVVKAGGYRGNVGPAEDYDLWLRLAPSHVFAACPEILYKWRVNPRGLSHSNSGLQVSSAAKLRSAYAAAHPFVDGGAINLIRLYRQLRRSPQEFDRILAAQFAAERRLVLGLPIGFLAKLKALIIFSAMCPDALRIVWRGCKFFVRKQYLRCRKIIKIVFRRPI